MRSSKNTCLADFFMLLTARIIVSGLTSILTAVDITRPPSFASTILKIPCQDPHYIICEAFGGVKQWPVVTPGAIMGRGIDSDRILIDRFSIRR